MRKRSKIILSVLAVLIILGVVLGSIVFLDVAAYTATSSQTLTPTGTPLGKAIVVYDPGLSGAAKGVANKVASDLQASGYTVTLAGIKSSAAAHTTGYGIIVVGGPVYGDSLTASVKSYLNNLKPVAGVKVGVFGSGDFASTPSTVSTMRNSVSTLTGSGTLANAVVVKIGQSENLNSRAQDFVNQLT
jgi:flavodoxin